MRRCALRTSLGWLLCLAAVCQFPSRAFAADTEPSLFRAENLVAWCIVPFDSQKRGPEARAAMLKKLGITKLAYDYRAEHIPTFDAEIAALQQQHIELTAWWFPTALNDEAKHILAVIEKHKIHPQLWITGGGGPTANPEEQAARVQAEAARIRPLAEAAAKVGCQVALYNHGGWFGEPENQVAIIEALKLPNVGIVYNLHHGHSHMERLPALLKLMRPHLLAFNLNGMVPNGDQIGQKIVPIGAGELDPQWLKTLQDSDYTGLIGILNHTDHDVELRLLDNLEGLTWLQQQAMGKKSEPPQYRTWETPKVTATNLGQVYPGKAEYRQPPLTVECHVTLPDSHGYNILVASDTKSSGAHWELFTHPGSGKLSAYLPGYQPDHVHSPRTLCDNRPHHVAMQFEPQQVRLFVDGEQVAVQTVKSTGRPEAPGGFAIGRLVEGGLSSCGSIEWVRLSQGIREVPATPMDRVTREADTIELWMFAAAPSVTPVTLTVSEYDPQRVAQIVSDAAKQGDAGQGVLTYASAKLACVSCHKIGSVGGSVGPDFTTIGKQRTPAQIAESILWPKREVKPEYQTWTVVNDSGRVVRGYKVRDDAQEVVLRDPALGVEHIFAKESIEDLVESGTLMPDGLAAAMTPEQLRDVVKLLSSMGNDSTLTVDSIAQTISRSQVHGPAPFEFTREPLHPEDWPNWQAKVNRDRLYDFYAKEADYFRKQDHIPPMLPEFPGLDGGVLGHWGNQNEEVWADARWNETTLGTVQAGIFRAKDVLVPRGVCVRLGDHGELSACFNPETLTYDAVWKNGFVTFSSVRHGFMHGLQMQGELLPKPAGSKPSEPFRYLGFYRDGPRVAFAYRIGNVEYLDAPWVKDGQLERIVAPVAEHPLKEMVQGGRPQWPQAIPVTGSLDTGSPYAVDTIPLPFENPWKALVFCGDHDFLSDGSALVCTMQGDVWHATGLDGDLSKITWRRFASGLHHALGLKVVDDAIYVQGRDQITRLYDRNQDGEADYYECFSQAFQTSPAGHDFICGLERDAAGNFYTASGNQGLIKISPDGQQAEVIATGFRNPDGLGLTHDGVLTVPCSEGDWTPSSMICAVRQGMSNTHIASAKPVGGFQPPFYGYGGPKEGRAPDLPLVYIPRGLDNSSGGQIEVTSNRWGPLQGQMLHFSFGAGSHFLLLRDEVAGQLQGALVPLPGEFRSGAHRGRFNPADGQLYVSGMAGWGSYTPDDGCFQRVRYTGADVQLPTGFHVHQNGVRLTFTAPLDKAIASQPRSHFAQAWNYRYSGGYGSAEFSTKHYGARGHDSLLITQSHVLDDGSLFLEIPELQPVNQLHLRVQVAQDQFRDLFLTVHRLDEPFTQLPGYRAIAKTITPHPIVTDLTLATSSVPNPWRKRNKLARPITIEAGKNLSFATRSFTVKSGELLAITLKNPDVVPHNWALVKPGTLSRVGELSNKLIADPDAVARHYIPQTDDVLFYCDVVSPQDEFTIWFHAPKEPGRYPYLCTFPGHWMVMNGEMIVE